MGIDLVLEESDFAGYIEDGTIYEATVLNIGLRERKIRDEDVKRIEFKFRLNADDAHDGQLIWGSTSTRFIDHPNCKLKNWAEALLGRELPSGYRLNTDDLLERRCRVVISKREWTNKDGEEQVRNEVRDVIPTKEVLAAMAAADDQF